MIVSCLTVHGSEILYNEVAMTCLFPHRMHRDLYITTWPGQISSPFLAPSKHSRPWWLFKQGQLWETSSESESQQVKFHRRLVTRSVHKLLVCTIGRKVKFCSVFYAEKWTAQSSTSTVPRSNSQCICDRTPDRLRCCTMNFGWNWNGSNHGIITWD